MFDFRTMLGLLLLSIVGLIQLQGHSAQLVVGPDKRAEPEKKEPEKRRRILPIIREVAEQQIKKPIGTWHAPTREFVTHRWETFSGKAQVGGTTSPDGAEEIQIDLPTEFHLRNKGGTDGAGLCVWCSLQHASVWQHVKQTSDIFAWMQKRTGGGWPQRVDELLPKISKELGMPTPAYVQIQNRDLEVLKLATKTNRAPGVTYNFSPTGRYNGRIAHMVSLVHLTDRWACILDNNFPGTYEWMDPNTFRQVYTYGATGWAVVFKDPGPPPPPRNHAS